MVSRGEIDLLNEQKQAKLNAMFSREHGITYLQTLNEVAQQDDQGKLDLFRGWVDTNYPSMTQLFHPLGDNYDSVVLSFVDSLVVRNALTSPLVDAGGLSPGMVSLQQSLEMTRILKDSPEAFIPPSKRMRWSNEEEDFLLAKLLEDKTFRQAYLEYANSAISKGFTIYQTKKQIKEGKKVIKARMVRTENSFRAKYKRLAKKVQQ